VSEPEHVASSPRVPISPTMVMILQARALEQRVESELAQSNLSLRKVGLLGHLRREPGISYSALARRAGIRVQSLQPIIESLLADEYVRAVGGIGQGRAAVIELTEHGVEALERSTAVIAQTDAETFVDDWAELGRALSGLGESLWRERGNGSAAP
jgi:DNA-binding MarR family transcriptional regulator